MLWVRPTDLPRVSRSRFLIFLIGVGGDEEYQGGFQRLADFSRSVGGIVSLAAFGRHWGRGLSSPLDAPTATTEDGVIQVEFRAGDHVCSLPALQTASRIVLLINGTRRQDDDRGKIEEECQAFEKWLRGSGSNLETCHVIVFGTEQGTSMQKRGSTLERFIAAARDRNQGLTTFEQSIDTAYEIIIRRLAEELVSVQGEFIKEAEAASRSRTEVERYLLHSQKELGSLRQRLFHAQGVSEVFLKKYRDTEIEAQTRLLEFEVALSSCQRELSNLQRAQEEVLNQLKTVTQERDLLRVEFEQATDLSKPKTIKDRVRWLLDR